MYGITDDIIMSVEEENKKYYTWAMHDTNTNSECQDIKELISRWPDRKQLNS